MTQVTTTYLKLQAADFSPKWSTAPIVWMHNAIPSGELQQFLYVGVGRLWQWYQKANWSIEAWQEYAEQPNMHTWVGYLEGTPMGYGQWTQHAHHVNIEYFGLFPQFLDQGVGGHLLSLVTQQALELSNVVTVNTCTLDHPFALNNYRARGFRVYKSETFAIDIPAM